MIFSAVDSIPGAWVIDVDRQVDDRGWFARTFAHDDFVSRGLAAVFVETSVSFNRAALTLRGMHLQLEPNAECKLIRCCRGRVFDVMVDARRDSPGFGRWAGFDLDPERGRSVYLPEGVAHGFLTLEDKSELSYEISARYAPQSAGGFRWDDPAVGIRWPSVPAIMSDRDRALPTLAELVALSRGNTMTESAHDDRAEFEEMKLAAATAMGNDIDLSRRALDVWIDADRYNYSYEWTWLGVPIIQIPPDIVATQEIIWACRPQLIVETGIARGGSAILSSSILELIGDGRVVAVDIDIRAHNRDAIEAHPMSRRIDLIQGSSVDPDVVARVAELAAGVERVMVILDSNHTHEHVLAELEVYAPMVTPGQFLIVADTVIEHIPEQKHRPRPWAPGNSPATALDDYIARFPRFEADPYVNAKLLMTSSPGGYLRCVAP